MTADVLPGAVVVTGGASGIGRAVALACARHGVPVGVLDLDERGARRTADEASECGAAAVTAQPCDVRNEQSVAAAVAACAEDLGSIRGLVTCAGIGSGGLVHQLPLDTWNTVIETNLTGTFLTCKHVLIQMLGHGRGGSIVCASSPWGLVSAPGGASAYSASKGGISAFVRSLALDYISDSIRVNAIVPGATETPLMWAGLSRDEIPAARRRIGKQLAIGRLADPGEIAEGIIWLLGDSSSYVTGSHLVVDGGLMARASIES